MSMNPQLGLALLCDPDGRFSRVLRDDFGLLEALTPGQPFCGLFDTDSREKAIAFLSTIQQNGAAFNWELNLARGSHTSSLCFAGSRSDEGLLIFGGVSREAVLKLLDDVSRSRHPLEAVLNTASAALKATQGSAHPDEYVFEELTRVNNELTNAHRELAKTNAELSGALRSLEQQNAQIRSQAQLLDIAYDAIIVQALDGTISYWNRGATQLYGWQAEEALGQNIHVLLRSEIREPVSAVDNALLKHGAWEGEQVQVARDGSSIIVGTRQVLRRGENGVADSVLVINRDITQRKRTEDALRVSDKMAAAARLASALAHEINNPLGILTNTMFLLQQNGTTPEGVKMVQRAEDALERVTSITRQMLALYREDAVPDSIDARNVLSDVVVAFADFIQAKRIDFLERYDDVGDVVAVEADLLHITSSVIRNALENVAEGGRVRIHLGSGKRSTGMSVCGLRFIVSDNGPGISTAQRRHLFEPFFSTKDRRGAGLGLWTTKNLVHKYGGEIRVRSCTRVGRSGTTVWIFLPTIAHASD